MYARRVNDQELTLVVSGMLWQRSLVMLDKETQSLWAHLLGRSMRGTLKDSQLESIPALLTDWKTWQKLHPQTTVMLMKRTSKRFTKEVYKDLKKYVVGMSRGATARAWPFPDLENQPLVNDDIGGTPIILFFHRTSGTPFAFDRRVDLRELTFELQNGKVIDLESQSTWDLEIGVAISGALKGKKLKPMVAISSFDEAWKNFHPESEYWHPENATEADETNHGKTP